MLSRQSVVKLLRNVFARVDAQMGEKGIYIDISNVKIHEGPTKLFFSERSHIKSFLPEYEICLPRSLYQTSHSTQGEDSTQYPVRPLQLI